MADLHFLANPARFRRFSQRVQRIHDQKTAIGAQD